jgi:DNA-directed RNA polymerase specialized sigma24 family protein
MGSSDYPQQPELLPSPTPHLSFARQSVRLPARVRAAELLRERRSSVEIVQLLGVSLSSVKRWKKAWLASPTSD